MSNIPNTSSLWLDAYPQPKKDWNKYERGHVLVMGGDMTGAGKLVARAAMRIGAGMVTIACSPQTVPIYSGDMASFIIAPVESVTANLAEFIEQRKVSAIVVGPGFAPVDYTLTLTLLLLEVSRRKKIPVIVDGGALTAFAHSPGILLEALHSDCIITPHRGEYKRLFLTSEGDTPSLAVAATTKSKAIVLLKGADTTVAAPKGMVVVNTNASPYLATAGSGDVLSGMIGGLAGQGMPLFKAATAAVWIHGETGKKLGIGLVADDLPEAIPDVVRGLLD